MCTIMIFNIPLYNIPNNKLSHGAVLTFLLSKVIMWVQFLWSVIVIAKQKICTCISSNQKKSQNQSLDFSCTLTKIQVVARNADWFIALFAPVVLSCSTLVMDFQQPFGNHSNSLQYKAQISSQWTKLCSNFTGHLIFIASFYPENNWMNKFWWEV